MHVGNLHWQAIALGYATSLLGGFILVGGGHCWLRHWMEGLEFRICRLVRCAWFGMPPTRGSVRPVPGGLAGFIERLVFTTFTVATPGAAPVAMGGWIGAKIAANWQRDLPAEDGEEPSRDEVFDRIRRGFAALLADLSSMFVAWIGGAIIYQSMNP